MTKVVKAFVGLVGFFALVAGMMVPTPPASAAAPYDNTIRFSGYGYGHGWGMSQYGAYGAAKQGLTWTQIMAFYYPGTTVTSLPSNQQIRVWISADNDRSLAVKPASGLRVRTSNDVLYTLPTVAGTLGWRIIRGATTWQLERLDSTGWKLHQQKALPTTNNWWAFENASSGVVDLMLPSGATARYRGSMTLRMDGSAFRTVNTLPMDMYLRGVVPAEMPSGWAAQALNAQSVAARTYSARRMRPTAVYDVCDTTTCQVYRGMSVETTNTNNAIAATAGKVLKYGTTLADTLFSSSNGGYTVSGGQPYLPAKADPYDASMNQVWTASATSAELSSAFGVGTIKDMIIMARDGKGALGGRVTSVRIVGSLKTITVSGETLRSRLGLRSPLLTFSAGLRPGGATYNLWQKHGGITGWMGMPAGDERAISGGSRVPMRGAVIYYSSGTGAHELHGANLRVYNEVNGPSILGFPTSDEMAGPVAGSRMNTFQRGAIYYTPATSSHEIHGAIYNRYRINNAPAVLGVPVTHELVGAVPGSRKTAFQKGGIYWTSATGAKALWGPTWTRYRSLGEERSSLGVPISEPVTSGTTVTTRFQHGSIVCTGATCSVKA